MHYPESCRVHRRHMLLLVNDDCKSDSTESCYQPALVQIFNLPYLCINSTFGSTAFHLYLLIQVITCLTVSFRRLCLYLSCLTDMRGRFQYEYTFNRCIYFLPSREEIPILLFLKIAFISLYVGYMCVEVREQLLGLLFLLPNQYVGFRHRTQVARCAQQVLSPAETYCWLPISLYPASPSNAFYQNREWTWKVDYVLRAGHLHQWQWAVCISNSLQWILRKGCSLKPRGRLEAANGVVRSHCCPSLYQDHSPTWKLHMPISCVLGCMVVGWLLSISHVFLCRGYLWAVAVAESGADMTMDGDTIKDWDLAMVLFGLQIYWIDWVSIFLPPLWYHERLSPYISSRWTIPAEEEDCNHAWGHPKTESLSDWRKEWVAPGFSQCSRQCFLIPLAFSSIATPPLASCYFSGLILQIFVSGRFFFINQFPNLGLSSWLYFISSDSFPSDLTQTVCFSAFSMLLTSQTTAQCQSFLLKSVIASHLLNISFCTFCRHLNWQVWVAFIHILAPFGSAFLMSVNGNPILTLTGNVIDFSLSCPIFYLSANDVILNSDFIASVIAKLRYHRLPGNLLSASLYPSGLQFTLHIVAAGILLNACQIASLLFSKPPVASWLTSS